MNQLKSAAVIAAVIYFSIAAYGAARGGLDDTDPPRGDRFFPARSGLVPYTDHGTGCQYLRAGALFGGSALTPRLGPDGRPMCGQAKL
jgi:hypothetical protein